MAPTAKPATTSPDDALRLANLLLYGMKIFVRQPDGSEAAYRIVECEFYLWDDTHQDPTVHRDLVQYQFEKLYFHRTGIAGQHKENASYKAGTYKCLDFTFGNDGVNGLPVRACGMLIRGI